MLTPPSTWKRRLRQASPRSFQRSLSSTLTAHGLTSTPPRLRHTTPPATCTRPTRRSATATWCSHRRFVRLPNGSHRAPQRRWRRRDAYSNGWTITSRGLLHANIRPSKTYLLMCSTTTTATADRSHCSSLRCVVRSAFLPISRVDSCCTRAKKTSTTGAKYTFRNMDGCLWTSRSASLPTPRTSRRLTSSLEA